MAVLVRSVCATTFATIRPVVITPRRRMSAASSSTATLPEATLIAALRVLRAAEIDAFEFCASRGWFQDWPLLEVSPIPDAVSLAVLPGSSASASASISAAAVETGSSHVEIQNALDVVLGSGKKAARKIANNFRDVLDLPAQTHVHSESNTPEGSHDEKRTSSSTLPFGGRENGRQKVRRCEVHITAVPADWKDDPTNNALVFLGNGLA